jgi:hypothetical protein
MVNELMTELHVDITDEETATITSLIDDATDMVNGSLGIVDNSKLVNESLYKRAIKTLTTQLYYDRTLSTGLSHGLILMLIQLEVKVADNGIK